MSRKKSTAANRINGVEIGEGEKTASPHAQESVFLKRSKRRRLDLRTLHGTAREHGKVYRALAEGTISPLEAEGRSRVLGRHREILTSLEQMQQLQAIQEQLRALRGDPSPQLMIDESKGSNS